jgi:hypothetical protein
MPFGLGFFATAGAGGAAGSFDLLETQVLGSSTSSVTFSSLSTYASTYQHLQIRLMANSNQSGAVGSYTNLNFNGVTSASYSRHLIYGNGSSVASAATTSASTITFQTLPGTSATNIFAAGIVDILDPFETTKNKTIRALVGSTSPNEIALSSGAFLSTNAVTSLSLSPAVGQFNTGSRFSLYGIKAA